MNEGQQKPGRYKGALYLGVLVLGVLAAGMVIESCDSEKVQVCDTTTGECHLESTCRPLLVDLLT